MTRLVADRVAVRVPATCANLGPGFDSLGLALTVRDDLLLEAIAGPSEVTIVGEGEDSLPRDESHLTLRAARIALDYAGASQVGLRLHAHNRIPQGRGLGSSAAATMAGLVAARTLLDDAASQPGGPLDDDAVIALAGEIEGHPDNVAPALLGGLCVAWVDAEDGHRAVRVEITENLDLAVVIPQEQLATTQARHALPDTIDFSAASANIARTALLIHSLSAGKTELLLAATADQLHQEARRQAMPATLELVDELRGYQLPAVVSGAGPSVLIFGVLPSLLAGDLTNRGWQVLTPDVETVGTQARRLPRD